MLLEKFSASVQFETEAMFCFVPFWIFSQNELARLSFGSQLRPVIFTFAAGGDSVKRLMGIVRRIDRRGETRSVANFSVTVWGVDTQGERFLQEARVRDFSLSGALLSGLEADLRSGDVIGVLYAGAKARFRVVWVRYDDVGDKVQAAIHRIAPDVCPWQALLPNDAATSEPQAEPEIPDDRI